MNIKKSMLVAGVTSTMAIASVAGASAATTSSANDGQDSLVSKIATKFKLDKSEVKAVFDEERTAREAEHQKEVSSNLDKLVTNGTITSAQKDAILAKQAEMKKDMQANRGNMKDKTDSERKAAMDQKKADLEKWASDNGLSADVLKQVMMGGHHGGRMGGGPHGPN